MPLSLLRQTSKEVRPSPTPVTSSSLPPPTCFTSATSGSPMATRATLLTWITFCCPTPRLMVPPSDCARACRAQSRGSAARAKRRCSRIGGQHTSKKVRVDNRSKHRGAEEEGPGRPRRDGHTVGHVLRALPPEQL